MFAAVKFAEANDEGELEISYEVINTAWLVTDGDGQQSCRWPPKATYKRKQQTDLVKTLAPAESEWPILPCEVVKFYGKFI